MQWILVTEPVEDWALSWVEGRIRANQWAAHEVKHRDSVVFVQAPWTDALGTRHAGMRLQGGEAAYAGVSWDEGRAFLQAGPTPHPALARWYPGGSGPAAMGLRVNVTGDQTCQSSACGA